MMPKRFTDTDQWKKAWFRKLDPKMKLFWHYICTNCDYCGIWDIDFEMASFVIGNKYDQDKVLLAFEGKIELIEQDKIFIPSFISFQYGATPGASKQHQSVNRRLQEYGIEWTELGSKKRTIPIATQESQPETTSRTTETLEKAKIIKDQVNQIRAAYPLNNGGEIANKSVQQAIKVHGFEKVLLGTNNYAKKMIGQDPKYIKSTARFFKEEVYLDFDGEEKAILTFPQDSDPYQLSKFFYEGVRNWTAGIMATEPEIQAGAVHMEEMLARQEIEPPMIVDLCKWIDKHSAKKISGDTWSWRTIMRTAKDLKERFLRNEFHEFTKSYKNRSVSAS